MSAVRTDNFVLHTGSTEKIMNTKYIVPVTLPEALLKTNPGCHNFKLM